MKIILYFALLCVGSAFGQTHPEIYISPNQKLDFETRVENSARVQEFIAHTKQKIAPYVDRHTNEPDWIVSRLQMYWNNKYERVYVNGMDFSHGEGQAAIPTVKFSGSRDWATDYLKPALVDVKPYLDDDRGMYLQNDNKAGKPWEWVKESETGHIIENINRDILKLAEESAFIYWLTKEEKYAVFASDILMTYLTGMHHREPPLTVEDHKNQYLMGLQTFEVIHEGIIEQVTVCYDFIYDYLIKEKKDVKMAQSVFQKWADQEIKYGVPGNNWNMMQARFITYLAIALEDDAFYANGKGQQYYFDQVLNQNSIRQKALSDVMKIYDPETAIWPEVAGYSIMVTDDLLEIVGLMDRVLNNQLLAQFPLLEKAIYANFNYLAPNGFTVAYGDAKHSRLRSSSLELLAAQYRKYGQKQQEVLISQQLHNFIADKAYSRDEIASLFQLFFYVDELQKTEAKEENTGIVNPTFYSPNVSWLVQRNGNTAANGMMISSNASLGNHSHTNGINMELYAKGMAIAIDAAAGTSYWSQDHIEYYSRFPAHNTVVVDGVSDYRNMRGTQAFDLKTIYPNVSQTKLYGDFTFSDVSFVEPSTNALQSRLLGTVRTGESSGYFIDIFRSSRKDGKDKKHEYIFHSQGVLNSLKGQDGNTLKTQKTEELSSQKGDQKGYDYFTDKNELAYSNNFKATFTMPSNQAEELSVNLWMNGAADRTIFTANSPYSRAINKASVPVDLYHKESPTLIVRQNGEARKRPFVSVIEAVDGLEQNKIVKVGYFSSQDQNPDFVGINVTSQNGRTDVIYNTVDTTVKHSFSDGSFTGTYAIVSKEQGELKSLFLGNGTLLTTSGWQVESKLPNTSVLVQFGEGSIHVNAEHAFKLRIPLNEKEQPFTLKSKGDKISQEFKAKLIKEHSNRFLEFDLPMLEGAVLEKI